MMNYVLILLFFTVGIAQWLSWRVKIMWVRFLAFELLLVPSMLLATTLVDGQLSLEHFVGIVILGVLNELLGRSIRQILYLMVKYVFLPLLGWKNKVEFEKSRNNN